jgi:hypothetical protein
MRHGPDEHEQPRHDDDEQDRQRKNDMFVDTGDSDLERPPELPDLPDNPDKIDMPEDNA